MKRRGFTKVGLVVIIATIAILVTMLLPVVRAARIVARRSQCANSYRPLGPDGKFIPQREPTALDTFFEVVNETWRELTQ